MKVLLLTPPLTQLNTPYPATAFLTGYLQQIGIHSTLQKDVGIELLLRLLSVEGLLEIKKVIESQSRHQWAEESVHFIEQFAHYHATVDAAVQFLQNKNPTLALRIAQRNFLPEGRSFAAIDAWRQFDDEELHWAFGQLGVQDRAKYYASLYVDDLCQIIQRAVDEKFSMSKYGERLAAPFIDFSAMDTAVEHSNSLVDQYLKAIVVDYLQEMLPDLVCLSVPFPGNLYGALKIAKIIKETYPQIKIAMGGGYPNTELRQCNEIRLFKYIDFISLDDGELPLSRILAYTNAEIMQEQLVRTFMYDGQKISFFNDPDALDITQELTGNPTYKGLKLDQYLSIFEMLNPAHRIWSDGRWNKLMLAHGCYWRQCSFCDVNLDYIGRYQEASINKTIERIKSLIAETGQTGFHFVDEAAPPKVLFSLAKRLIEEKIAITWWGNIRFEKSFTYEMAELLARSGCVAVTGGLEVASDRLLKLMKKGVTLSQAAKVTHAFSTHGILVHTYLMYGFPSQTEQETIDSLEVVRQLFEQGCVQSAYWHRFAATIHSPVGKNPQQYGVTLLKGHPQAFAANDVAFVDAVKTDHDFLGRGLNKALYNYMLNIGIEEKLSFWFEKPVPRTQIKRNFISQFLKES